MGEAAKASGDGGPPARDGGAGDASALRRGRRATGPASQHTAAGRRIRPGRASAAASALSASRADEEQLPASTEQVRERRTGVGGRRRWRLRGERRARRWRWRRGRRVARQERRAAAEGDPVVGAHGRAAGAAVPARAPAALRHGPAPPLAAAGRVTPPPSPISRLHSIIGTIGLAAPTRASRSIIDSVFIYLGRGAARPCGCVCRCVAWCASVFLAPEPSRAITKTEIK